MPILRRKYLIITTNSEITYMYVVQLVMLTGDRTGKEGSSVLVSPESFGATARAARALM